MKHRINIDLSEIEAKTLKVIAAVNSKDRKNFIQELLSKIVNDYSNRPENLKTN